MKWHHWNETAGHSVTAGNLESIITRSPSFQFKSSGMLKDFSSSGYLAQDSTFHGSLWIEFGTKLYIGFLLETLVVRALRMEKHSVRSYGADPSSPKVRVTLLSCHATRSLQASELYEIQVNSPSLMTDKCRLRWGSRRMTQMLIACGRAGVTDLGSNKRSRGITEKRIL